MVSEKKNALYLSVNAFSAKVLIGGTILARTGDYPRIPRSGQLSRKKRRWPIIDPILVAFGQMKHCSNIATLCCAKNRRCESSRVTSPLLSIYVSTVLYNE